MRDIYINCIFNPLTKFTSSSRSTEFKDILPWNISQMIMKTIPINTRIVISHAMKRGIWFWVWWKVNGNWDSNMIKISQCRESHCRTNTSIRKKKYIQKNSIVRATVRQSISPPLFCPKFSKRGGLRNFQKNEGLRELTEILNVFLPQIFAWKKNSNTKYGLGGSIPNKDLGLC